MNKKVINTVLAQMQQDLNVGAKAKHVNILRVKKVR